MWVFFYFVFMCVCVCVCVCMYVCYVFCFEKCRHLVFQLLLRAFGRIGRQHTILKSRLPLLLLLLMIYFFLFSPLSSPSVFAFPTTPFLHVVNLQPVCMPICQFAPPPFSLLLVLTTSCNERMLWKNLV